jgi:hypothetical protein
MGLKERGWKSVDWIYLAEVRSWRRALLKTLINFRLP